MSQPSASRSLSRRSLLGAGLAATGTGLLAPGATACATGTGSDRKAAPVAAGEVAARLRELERRHEARIGVYARNTRTGATVRHRSGELFAMCSVLKGPLAGHVLRDLDRRGEYLERVLHYTEDDLVHFSIITEHFVDSGMAVRDLCGAAVSWSDNAATNVLLRHTGGPRAMTRFFRAIGDPHSRLDRFEPQASTAIPGDRRDTTTPEAMGRTFARLVLGDALNPRDRDLLTVWLKGNTSSGRRFRAGLPDDWVIGDKTGTGDYGTANDVGIVWTSRGTPLVLSVLTTKHEPDAEPDEPLVAAVARLLAHAVAPHG